MRKFKPYLPELIIAIVLLALVIVARLPTLRMPLDNDSGAIAYHARLMLNGEQLYGSHHPAHHLPAVYYTYMVAFKLLGDDQYSIKLFMIPWIWLNAIVIYLISRQFANRMISLFSAAIFILVSAMTNLGGDLAEIELFANLPISLVILLGIHFIKARARPIAFCLIGILGAICFLYKAVYLASIGAVVITLLIIGLAEKNRAGWEKLFWQSIAILVGFLIPLGAIGLYYFSAGLWDRFFLVFQLGAGYVNHNSLSVLFIVLFPIILLGFANITLVILALTSIILFLVHSRKNLAFDRNNGLLSFLFVVWALLSIFVAGFSRLPYSHYAQLLVPPFVIVVCKELNEIGRRISAGRHAAIRRLGAAWLPILVLTGIMINTFIVSSGYIEDYLNSMRGKMSFESFVRDQTPQGPDIIAASHIAQYIKENSTSQDYILNWTDAAQIDYLAERRSSTQVLWPVYIPVFDKGATPLDLNPFFIVTYGATFKKGDIPDWLSDTLSTSYVLVKAYDEGLSYQIYKRTPP